ncbi:non-ribosomal peptide synthetase [Crossiella cryophila]|uniref:Amino acid adenylation domain-containing protein n=1 Tax=Crossiella cryophila TaxID=43355 RepID=A0A7W7CC75_9PSEU|nr:non-ribosomal peptide synthetase [Crossiella cryophila]MBB4678434.1 amino acid adenylation domain-containing protein [Crossiella cryophila]
MPVTRTRLPAPAEHPRWTENVPAPADSPLAERRRTAELTRPASTPRSVQLVYPDGTADLFETTPPPPLPASAPAPPWGLGEGKGIATQHIPLTHLGDESTWLTALKDLLTRYNPDQSPEIATPGSQNPAPVAFLFDATPHPGEHLPTQHPTHPLTISVHQDTTGSHLRCVHHRAEVSEHQAHQFLRHLHHLHTTPGAQLPPAAELPPLIALGHPATDLTTTPRTIHESIQSVAASNPDAIAITDGPTQLTYRELLDRAARIAGGLQARGVHPGDRIGVCLDRTADLVVVLLGVLTAGATYVPMDPAYPTERLAHTTQDANLPLVITHLADFPGPTATFADLEAAEPATAPSTPDSAAYVIYTSGSTGRPKGVVVPHRNVIALLDATRDEYALGPQDVWTWFHSSAFDFSVWEIWGCLLTGGRLVVVPYFVSREPDRFAELLAAESVTVLSQTPSAFAQLLQIDHRPLTPRLVIFGGEPLDARMLLPWFDSHPESACRVVNMFGITETTVHVTHQTITRHEALTASRSVGPALPGWHLLVVNPEGHPQPIGVPGEICVGGAGVATAYLNQETLTAQRFRDNPHTGTRLYHSGDLGRLRPDGRLEHLGRIDSQIKLRGFRIELDEIRNVLLEDPTITAAAVILHQPNPEDPATAHLAAYVVPATTNPTAARTRAATLLPDHMLPTTITPLETLPLTPNGKLDPTQLPAPAAQSVAVPANPTNLTEHLATIWQEVLGHPVGPHDDFFDLGGNSLLAVRLGAAMRANGLPQIRLRELYRHPTITELTELLQS